MKQYIEKALEMRGMNRSEILNYFISLGENSMDNKKFVGRGWEVELCDEKIITLGVIKIPTTIVIFRGTQDTVEKAIWAFRLRFLSAGG
jgi:hypothetical protein